MPKAQILQLDVDAASVTPIGISIGDMVAPGSIISLNMLKTIFFAVEGGFFLNSEKPTSAVPGGLSEKAMDDLQRALDDHVIVLGCTPIKPEPEEDLLVEHCKRLDLTKTLGDAQRVVASLYRKAKKNPDSTYTRYCMTSLAAFEVANQNRKDIIDYINAGLEKIEGPTRPTETVMGETTLNIPIKPEKEEQHYITPAATNPDI